MDSEWPVPIFDTETDGPDAAIPCPFCGAGALEPCAETCETLAPIDIPGTDVDWSNVAAAWSNSPWAGELHDDDVE